METADGDINKITAMRHKRLSVDGDPQFSFQDVKTLLFPTVAVRRRSASRRHDGLDERVLAVGFLAGGQQVIHVPHDRDRASFADFASDSFASHAEWALVRVCRSDATVGASVAPWDTVDAGIITAGGVKPNDGKHSHGGKSARFENASEEPRYPSLEARGVAAGAMQVRNRRSMISRSKGELVFLRATSRWRRARSRSPARR